MPGQTQNGVRLLIVKQLPWQQHQRRDETTSRGTTGTSVGVRLVARPGPYYRLGTVTDQFGDFSRSLTLSLVRFCSVFARIYLCLSVCVCVCVCDFVTCSDDRHRITLCTNAVAIEFHRPLARQCMP